MDMLSGNKPLVGRTRAKIGRTRLRSLAAVAIGVIAMIALALGYVVGVNEATVRIQVGVASGVDGVITTIEADGWTYSVPDGVMWVDPTGVWHDSGRPACLPSTSAAVMEVAFGSMVAEIEGGSWRPVVWVSCADTDR